MMYQIPKTTLFREKTRLVEAGKLPWNSLKRKDPQSHSVNNVRLKEAVDACKDGKMSQAVASITYQVVAWKPACRAFSLHRASCKTFLSGSQDNYLEEIAERYATGSEARAIR